MCSLICRRCELARTIAASSLVGSPCGFPRTTTASFSIAYCMSLIAILMRTFSEAIYASLITTLLSKYACVCIYNLLLFSSEWRKSSCYRLIYDNIPVKSYSKRYLLLWHELIRSLGNIEIPEAIFWWILEFIHLEISMMQLSEVKVLLIVISGAWNW